MNHRLVGFSFAVVLAAAGVRSATAWQIEVCEGPRGANRVQWREDPTMRASARGFPEGRRPAAALRDVIDGWNRSPADFAFELQFGEPGSRLGNDENEVWFSDNPETLEGAPAVAFTWDDCEDDDVSDKGILETDVVFACDPDWADCDELADNESVDWGFRTLKTLFGDYGGENQHFRSAATHEFGHALGLKHESGEYNVMGTDWTHVHAYGTGATAYPGEDASDGAVELYGASDVPREDVSVVHWKYAGWAVDGYSVHVRTAVQDADGAQLACDPCDNVDTEAGNEEPLFLVDSGQEVQVEFSFENSGSSIQSGVRVAFLLSADPLLSFGDRRIGSRRPDLIRNRVHTAATSVQLPNDLVSGRTYFILALIDEDGAIDEVDESNNLSYVGIKVN